MLHPKSEIHIGIIGKYAELEDAYASIKEALIHAGAKHEVKIVRNWIPSADIEKDPRLLDTLRADKKLDALIVPGGFGQRGTE